MLREEYEFYTQPAQIEIENPRCRYVRRVQDDVLPLAGPGRRQHEVGARLYTGEPQRRCRRHTGHGQRALQPVRQCVRPVQPDARQSPVVGAGGEGDAQRVGLLVPPAVRGLPQPGVDRLPGARRVPVVDRRLGVRARVRPVRVRVVRRRRRGLRRDPGTALGIEPLDAVPAQPRRVLRGVGHVRAELSLARPAPRARTPARAGIRRRRGVGFAGRGPRLLPRGVRSHRVGPRGWCREPRPQVRPGHRTVARDVLGRHAQSHHKRDGDERRTAPNPGVDASTHAGSIPP